MKSYLRTIKLEYTNKKSTTVGNLFLSFKESTKQFRHARAQKNTSRQLKTNFFIRLVRAVTVVSQYRAIKIAPGIQKEFAQRNLTIRAISILANLFKNPALPAGGHES